jgi:hypothetical protein
MLKNMIEEVMNRRLVYSFVGDSEKSTSLSLNASASFGLIPPLANTHRYGISRRLYMISAFPLFHVGIFAVPLHDTLLACGSYDQIYTV